MRRLVRCLGLLWVLASFAATARAQSVPASDTARAAQWVTARERAARGGGADLVELPLAIASEGWGCICPNSYVGTNPDAFGEIAWLDVTLGPGVNLPAAGSGGSVSIVRGYFTGVVRHVQLGPESDPGGYDLHAFVVTEVVRARVPASFDAAVSLRVRSAASIPCESAVSDATPLRVRARADTESPVLAELPDGTRVTIDRSRGVWLQISAPAAGWVHRDHVLTTCTPAR